MNLMFAMLNQALPTLIHRLSLSLALFLLLLLPKGPSTCTLFTITTVNYDSNKDNIPGVLCMVDSDSDSNDDSNATPFLDKYKLSCVHTNFPTAFDDTQIHLEFSTDEDEDEDAFVIWTVLIPPSPPIDNT
jgi:hypothetical protein